jgi:GTP-binding protein Era
MKSGFVSIIGKPNVGKSTLINDIVGSKISIVTPKGQTTRNSITGIYNDEESQIVFFDTPGIHKPFNELGIALDKISYSTIRDCDIALLVVDAGREYDESDAFLCEKLKFDCKLIVVFNKIDTTRIELITSIKEKYNTLFPDALTCEICAKDGFGVTDLIKLIKENLEEGPAYYDVTQITDRDLSFRVQEIIREKLLTLLDKEVPHGVLVLTEKIAKESGRLSIYCKIICEKESQKGIIIGKGGKMIKKIGTYSRQDIEKMLGQHINLELVVQVVENWRNSSRFLVKAGYKI